MMRPLVEMMCLAAGAIVALIATTAKATK